MQVWWSEQPTGVSAALEAAGGPSDGAWSWAGVKGTHDVGKPMGDFPLPQFPHCIAGWYLLRVPPPLPLALNSPAAIFISCLLPRGLFKVGKNSMRHR